MSDYAGDVDERDEQECAYAQLQRRVREQTRDLCYGMYILGAESEFRRLIGTLANEGFTRSQIFDTIVLLRNAA